MQQLTEEQTPTQVHNVHAYTSCKAIHTNCIATISSAALQIAPKSIQVDLLLITALFLCIFLQNRLP